MANRLAEGIDAATGARLVWPSGSNELFVILERDTAKKLEEGGAVFYDWPVPHTLAGSIAADEGLYRLVTSFATTKEDVERFIAAC